MKIKNLKIKPIWLIIGLALLVIAGLTYVNNLEPATTYYNKVITVNGYDIMTRTSDYSTQYYLNPPGFRECISQGCRFGTFQEAKTYALSLPPASSTVTPISTTSAAVTPISTTSTTGTIKIWSYPDGAEIFVDSKPYGLTASDKHVIVTTTLGKHTVVLRKADYSFYTQEIDVTSTPIKIDAYLKSNKPNAPLPQTTSKIECPETHPFYDEETNSCYSDTPTMPSISSVGIIGILIITTLLIKRRKYEN